MAGAFAAALFLADQGTKYLVARDLWPGRAVEVLPRFFNLVLCPNTGGVFGLLPARPLVFMLLSLVAVALLGYLFTRLEGKTAASLAAAALLAGALGNLVDRFRFGYVVDFIDLHVGPWHWYVFNVADASITVGALSLFVLTFIDERRKQRRAKTSSAPPETPSDK
ncbi:MAG: signal peptidase II [Candidatus Coatesbacteria bacterium]|nr:MAG: signal peptidase II [Candidatus Coatesbacteria bacterium]